MNKVTTSIFRKVIVAFFLLFFCLNAYAVLEPEVVEEQRNSAKEKLRIEVIQSIEFDPNYYLRYEVEIEAVVTAVESSQSGVFVGDVIVIDSYYVPYYPGPWGLSGSKYYAPDAPKVPEVLPTGWTGRAFLNSNSESGLFDLAAYGDSFIIDDPVPAENWDPNTSYEKGDTVIYDGKIWRAFRSNQNITPEIHMWNPWKFVESI